MPLLDESHDFAHPVEGDTAWSESYYFNCYDPTSDSGFFTRIGIRPNEGTLDAGLSLWLPDMGMAHIGGIRPQHEMTDVDLEAGGVRYERIAPMKEWRLTADGDAAVIDLAGRRDARPAKVSVDVTFRALTPAIGTDGMEREGEGASVETRKSVGKGHLEQAGRWSGSITVDGEKLELGEARGNRDKSWGPRRWGGPLMWRWFSINISDETHFGGIRIGTDEGDLHRGWVWQDGKHASVSNWAVRTELEDDGVTHKVTHLTVDDKLGRTHEIRGDLLRVDPGNAGIRPSTTIVNEGLAKWTYRGQEGYGISEYLHQLDADARPVVRIE